MPPPNPPVERSLAVEPLQGHSYSVTSVAFSPDGARIVSGSGKTVRIWDAVSGAPIGEPLQGHSDPVTSVALSPDGVTVDIFLDAFHIILNVTCQPPARPS